ncbi:MAG TPA: RNA polymerase sigma factor [Actinomycetota bacterium]|nr:RNA polymerase sigma factor [Actinomycetota bacterium]
MEAETAVDALRRSVREPMAFARFYQEHAESLLLYFARRLHDADAALDLTAETFAQAYVARRRFRGDRDAVAAAWLYRIARRQLARYYRKGRAERKALSRLGMSVPAIAEDEGARIEELAGLAAMRAAVGAELQRLGTSQSEALWLRIVQELPYREVARRLGVSEEAARARVSRGLRALSAALEKAPEREEAR